MMFAPRSQRLVWPLAHHLQRPHDGRKESTTWSPGPTADTLGPTSRTVPAPSCPPTTGKGMGMSPVTRCSSEWHSPELASLISTSPSDGPSSSTSSTLHGSLRPHSTAASSFIDRVLHIL